MEEGIKIPSLEEKLITRKLLIVTCGTTASLHFLRGIFEKQPQIALENEFMIVETSRDQFTIAVKAISACYYAAYRKSVGKDIERPKGTPYSIFQHKLIKNSVLLAEGGGGATPETGLRYYNEQSNKVLQKIEEIVRPESGEGCYGIMVLGCSGKGTATLVAPALINDILGSTVLPAPIGVITLPFRFAKTGVDNAKMTIDYIVDNGIPVVLCDYAHAYHMYWYLKGEKIKMIPINKAYNAVVDALATVLSVLIEALNYGQYTLPPIDWSDLTSTLYDKGLAGTISYSYQRTLEDFAAKWRHDLDNLLLFKTKSPPKKTNVLTIMKAGAGIPLDIGEQIYKYFRYVWHAEKHLTPLLSMGEGFTLANIIFGFDPRDVDPELKEMGLTWLEKIRGV